jgi:hypothetical protein
MARPKKTPPKSPLQIHSITLTAHDAETLQQLSQDASDALGWTISNSAIIRALLRHVAQQPPAWSSSTLHPMIEQEIAGGLMWGKKK